MSSTSIADQRTDFDYDGAVRELARLRNELAIAQATTRSRTRYAAFDKGV